MKEVEVKARISDCAKIIAQLEALDCVFSEPLVQKDIIFLPKGRDFSNIVSGDSVLRIRNSNDKLIMTLKRQLSNELDNLEHEIVIDDAKQGAEIIQNMGYRRALQVEKTRRKTKYEGMTICIDSVEGLGDFIEVEKLTTDDSEKTQDELFTFLQTLGLTERVFEGYDTMIAKKSNS